MEDDEKKAGLKGKAGLAFAPPYDASMDLDPSKVAPVRSEGFDVHNLAYYQELERQRSFKIRIALILVLLVMIGANMWMVQNNRVSLSESNAQINQQLNQATSDRSVILDQLEMSDVRGSLQAINERLAVIEDRLGARD